MNGFSFKPCTFFFFDLILFLLFLLALLSKKNQETCFYLLEKKTRKAKPSEAATETHQKANQPSNWK